MAPEPLPREAPVSRNVRPTLAPRTQSGLEAGAQIYSGSHAVVIGVDAYRRLPVLNGAARDARRFADALERRGFRTTTLMDEAATRQAIASVLADELPSRLIGEDRLVIFFAGHGVTTGEGSAARGYLMPVDGDPRRPASSGISMTQLVEWIGDYPAKHVILVADACYSGLFMRRRAAPASRWSRSYLRQVTSRRARFMLVAGAADQAAYEARGQGVFTTAVLEGLDGQADANQDGLILGSELEAYVKPRVAGEVERRFGVDQLPQSRQLGEGEVVFLNPTVEPEATTARTSTAPSAPAEVRASLREARDRVQEALVEASRVLADASRQKAIAGHDQASIRLALRALPADLRDPERPYLPAAEAALREALDRRRSLRVLRPRKLRARPDEDTKVAFSSGGDWLVTAWDGEPTEIWDPGTGLRAATLRWKDRGVEADLISFSPDGRSLVAASYKGAHVFGLGTGQGRFKLEAGAGARWSARSIAFGRGNEVLSHDDDGFLRRWNRESGLLSKAVKCKPPRVWNGWSGVDRGDAWRWFSQNRVAGATIDATGRYVVCEAAEHLEVHDLQSPGRQIKMLHIGPKKATAVAFSTGREPVLLIGMSDGGVVGFRLSDGRREFAIAPAGAAVLKLAHQASPPRALAVYEDETFALIDIRRGSKIQFSSDRHRAGVIDASINPRRPLLVTAGRDNEAHIWSSETGRFMASLRGHGAPAFRGMDAAVIGATFSPDGRSVLTWGNDGSSRVWSLRGKQLAIVKHEHRPHFAVFSPDSSRVATASNSEHPIYVWSARDGEIIRLVTHEGDSVEALSFDRRGERLLSAADDRTVRVWNARTGRQLEAYGAGGRYSSLAYGPSGRYIATGRTDGVVRVFNADNGVLARSLVTQGRVVQGLAWGPGDRRIFTVSNNEGRWFGEMWSIPSGKKLFTLQASRQVKLRRPRYSPDGALIATANGADVELWSASSGARVRTLRGHTKRILSLNFSPDGSRLITGARDRTARVWTIATGVQDLALGGHEGDVVEARFSPDGAVVATASTDGTARLFRARNGRALSVLRGHGGELGGLAFSPDSRVLVTSGDDGTARTWSARRNPALRVVDLSPKDSEISAPPGSPTSGRLDSDLEGLVDRLRVIPQGLALDDRDNANSQQHDIQLSSDGRLLFGDSPRRGRLWGLPEGRLIQEFPKSLAEPLVIDPTWSHVLGQRCQHDLFSSSGDGYCHELRNLTEGTLTGQIRSRIQSSPETLSWRRKPQHNRFSPRGGYVISGVHQAAKNGYRVWRTRDAQPVESLRCPSGDPVWVEIDPFERSAVKVCPDAESGFGPGIETMLLQPLESGNATRIGRRRALPWRMSAPPHGRVWFAAGGRSVILEADGRVLRYSVGEARLDPIARLHQNTWIRISEDGRSLLFMSAEHALYRISLHQGDVTACELEAHAREFGMNRSASTAVALLESDGEATLVACDLASGEISYRRPYTGVGVSRGGLHVDPTGSRAVELGGDSGSAAPGPPTLHDLAGIAEPARLDLARLNLNSQSLWGFDFSPDGSRLLVETGRHEWVTGPGLMSSPVFLVDLASGQPLFGWKADQQLRTDRWLAMLSGRRRGEEHPGTVTLHALLPSLASVIDLARAGLGPSQPPDRPDEEPNLEPGLCSELAGPPGQSSCERALEAARRRELAEALYWARRAELASPNPRMAEWRSFLARTLPSVEVVLAVRRAHRDGRPPRTHASE